MWRRSEDILQNYTTKAINFLEKKLCEQQKQKELPPPTSAPTLYEFGRHYLPTAWSSKTQNKSKHLQIDYPIKLIPTVYQWILRLSHNQKFKSGKEFQETWLFPKENTQMANKHMKKWRISLSVREIQNTTAEAGRMLSICQAWPLSCVPWNPADRRTSS